jgi:hypothetical protein
MKTKNNLKFNYFTIILFLIIFITKSSSQEIPDQKIIYPHSVFWSKTEVNELFGDYTYGAGLDFVYRRKNEFNQGSMFDAPLRESIRPWFHYQFSPYARFSISPLGYMNTNEYVGKPEDRDRPSYYEYRTTFQFFHHTKQLNGRIMHTWRYRHELRWQHHQDEEDARFLTRFRFRYRVRVGINKEDFYENGIFYAAVSNEFGLNLGKSVVMNTFNQNRLYVGLGYRFLNSARVEFRYVDRFRTRGSTGFEFDHGRGIMLGLYVDQISLLGIGSDKVPQVRFSD